MKTQAVKLNGDTVEKLKKMDIEMGWVKLKSYDDKVNHLMWFFENYKNNNHKK